MIDREKTIKQLDEIGHYFFDIYRKEEDREESCLALDRADTVANAIFLLKEKEPLVMTIEDVREDHDRIVWIEFMACQSLIIGQYRGQVYWHNGLDGKWERFVTMSFADEYWYGESDKYGKKWRCWTSRPSDEQRKAVKWDD